MFPWRQIYQQLTFCLTSHQLMDPFTMSRLWRRELLPSSHLWVIWMCVCVCVRERERERVGIDNKIRTLLPRLSARKGVIIIYISFLASRDWEATWLKGSSDQDSEFGNLWSSQSISQASGSPLGPSRWVSVSAHLGGFWGEWQIPVVMWSRGCCGCVQHRNGHSNKKGEVPSDCCW